MIIYYFKGNVYQNVLTTVYNMKINAKFPLPSSDDSGMGSFGFDTDTGNKPKILIIRCLIPFSEAESLLQRLDQGAVI